MNYERLLKDLVGIKSYSGEEVEVKDYIKGWLEERQVAVVAQAGNLVVHLEGRDKTRAFIFNSHMDTVSAGDLPWKYGPWTPTTEDDRIVGLGASDMKSGLTASLLLAEKISHSGVPPVDMWFTYVVNEEVDGAGTKSFVDWFKDEGHLRRYTDMAAIFTEPTGFSELEHGHKGIKAVIFGPGEKDQAHKTDEYCYPTQIPKAVEIYRQIIDAWADK